MNIIVCLTARMSSERLPGKPMVDVCGRPNLERVVERYEAAESVSAVVVATTIDQSDDAIADWCRDAGKRCYRGSPDDVCRRISEASQTHDPDYVVRGLTDAPFVSPFLLDMGVDVTSLHGADAGRICAGPNVQPVYGAAEFPYSWRAVRQLDLSSSGSQREHFGTYLDAHRDEFDVIYPAPTREYYGIYFRPYRLELDTKADLELVREVYRRLGPGARPALHEVIALLDADPDLALSNSCVPERTGPLTTFTVRQRRGWMESMEGRRVDWGGDWTLLQGNRGAGRAIWCDAGQCYLGHIKRIKERGRALNVLVRPGDEVIKGDATLACSCGAGRKWHGG